MCVRMRMFVERGMGLSPFTHTKASNGPRESEKLSFLLHVKQCFHFQEENISVTAGLDVLGHCATALHVQGFCGRMWHHIPWLSNRSSPAALPLIFMHC